MPVTRRPFLPVAVTALMVALLSVGVVVPASAAETSVTTAAGFTTAVTTAGTTRVTLGSDIALTAAIVTVTATPLVLDLNGFALTTNTLALASGGSLTIVSGDAAAAGSLTATGNGAAGAAATSAIRTSGATLTINSGTVTATVPAPVSGASSNAAAIGGSGTGSVTPTGGTIVINGGTVRATTNGFGAAIGSGFGVAPAGNITITGGTVVAESTHTNGGSAIGSANGATGGSITISGGNVTATTSTNTSAPAIGSAYTTGAGGTVTISGQGTTVVARGGFGSALGGARLFAPSDVSIGAGTDVTLYSNGGNGVINVTSAAPWGTVTIAGKVTLSTGASLRVPQGALLTIAQTGQVTGLGQITGAGTIANYGTIDVASVLDVHASSSYLLTITENKFGVTFNGNGTSSPRTVYTYAPSFDAGKRAFPTLARSGYRFAGWNTAADGSGTPVTTSTVLTGNLTVYAQWRAISISPTSLTVFSNTSTTFTLTQLGTIASDRAEVPVLTTNNPLDVVTGTSILFRGAGTHIVTATYFEATAQASISVTLGPLTRIELSPASAAVTAGGSQAFTVEGFDAYGNSLGDRTASATFTTNTAGDVVTANSVRFTRAGSHVVTARVGALSTTQTATVAPGALATTVVSPATPTAVAGTTTTFSVEGFDAFGNSLGDVTPSATFTTGTVGDTVTGNSIRFSRTGSHIVTATVGTITATAAAAVTPGSLQTVVFHYPTSPILTSTPIAYSAEGFDSEGNSTGTMPVVITTDDPADTINGSTVTFAVVGPHRVTVAAAGFTEDSVASVAVNPAAVAALVVSLSAASVNVKGSVTVMVTANTIFGTSLGDVTDVVTLTSNYPTDVISGATVTFPTASTHVITATLAGVSGSANVTVIPAALPAAALPAAGTDSLSVIATAVLSLLLGLVALGASLRRRRSA